MHVLRPNHLAARRHHGSSHERPSRPVLRVQLALMIALLHCMPRHRAPMISTSNESTIPRTVTSFVVNFLLLNVTLNTKPASLNTKRSRVRASMYRFLQKDWLTELLPGSTILEATVHEGRGGMPGLIIFPQSTILARVKGTIRLHDQGTIGARSSI